LKLADNYGNAMKEFAGANKAEFGLKIIGDIFTESNPIILEQQQNIMGNTILFNLRKSDYNRYENALMLEIPYKLKLTF